MNIKLAPIILFVYNRIYQTRLTLEALSNNKLADQSVLYIYSDGAKDDATEIQKKNIADVRILVKEKLWCRKVIIIEQEENNGLANSIINGVTKIINEHGKVIVLEDDLITAIGFLEYMNKALDKYENEAKVMQISGYNFPLSNISNNKAYFMPFTTSWGWATWRRAWDCFDEHAIGYEALKNNSKLQNDFNLRGSYPYSQMLYDQVEHKSIDSWAIRWWWTVFRNKGVTLFPDITLINNIGFDKDATHTSEENPRLVNKHFNFNNAINHLPERVFIDAKNYKLVCLLLFISHSKISKSSFVNKLKQYLILYFRKIEYYFLTHKQSIKIFNSIFAFLSLF